MAPGNMSDQERSFTSKILLFGEYSVIRYSMALAIPYPLFEGRLRFHPSRQQVIDPELKAFAQYLKKLVDEGGFPHFDENSFLFDVSQGLYFDSTIPQGFGAGSSGALCAAIADRYSQIDLKEMSVPKLKEYFALMEAHFHGSSSGFDPLVSYLNSPILVAEDKQLSLAPIPSSGSGRGCLFLLNTGRARRTEPLVNLFLEKCKTMDFDELCRGPLTQWTNTCIHAFLNRELEVLFETFPLLSTFQYEHMKPMIPKLYQDLWQEGLTQGAYALKLCGAGGGGFLLGLTRDLDRMKKQFAGQEIRPLFYF